jgi:hypothetical protein
MLFSFRRKPVIAYRYWRVSDGQLEAPYYGDPWPNATMQAYCRATEQQGCCRRSDCFCGLYAITQRALSHNSFIQMHDGRMDDSRANMVFGAVILLGRRHASGGGSLRSERAQITGLLRSTAPHDAPSEWQQEHDAHLAAVAQTYHLPLTHTLAELYLTATDARVAPMAAS